MSRDVLSASDSLPLSLNRRVDECCDRFEAAWKAGRHPQIEEYLANAPDPERSELLRQLLALEIELRSMAGSSAHAAEYECRFPEYGGVIRDAFAAGRNKADVKAAGGDLDPSTGPFPSSEQSHSTDPRGPFLPESPPPIPERIGRYHVRRQLGAGTFGYVYLAWDDLMERQVAIKVPSSMLLASQSARDQFLSEARSVGRLEHEGIVRAYDFGQEADGQCYIVYEFIEGTNLAEYITARSLLPVEAARIVAQVAEALHYAHLQGLVHRDIKPANILLNRQSKPCITDFGLAVREEDLPKERGRLAGTLPYMSPEQVRRLSHHVDGRTDIYSLAVILYELLCGRRPFDAKNEDELKDQILHREAKPPRQIKDSISRELEQICLKGLSKRVHDRYTTAKDMAAELGKITEGGYFPKQFESQRERRDLKPLAALSIASGAEERIYALTKDRVTIGRQLGCDIVLKSPAVARYHAQLIRDGSQYLIEDLHSSNGTYVNGAGVTGRVLLKHNDRIHIGASILIYHRTGVACEQEHLPGKGTDQKEFTSPIIAGCPMPPVKALEPWEIRRQMQLADETELLRLLCLLEQRGDADCIRLIFRCLLHASEAVRSRARQALHSVGWNKVSTAVEDLARTGDPGLIRGVIDGLAAFEAHPQIVQLLDRLAVILKGDLRNQTILLLERKRLGLELDKVIALFKEIQSPYRIEKALGQGLFTAAYLARAEEADLEVVVRVLRPEFVAQPRVRAQFLDLSKKALPLIHENLVLTREVRAFPERNIYFVVRDYVNGVTLQKLLEKQKDFDAQQIVLLLRQLLAALAAIHRRGMGHGSIKPSNVFVCEDSRVVLGDTSLPIQGIGLALDRLSYDYRYAAPETFAGGDKMGPASDFYSLGCLAFELAFGAPPFASDNYLELAARHMHETVDFSRRGGGRFDPAGIELLQKLLARSPEDRPAKVENVLQALDQLETSWLKWGSDLEAKAREGSPKGSDDELLDKVLGRSKGPRGTPEEESEQFMTGDQKAKPLLHDKSLERLQGWESIVGFNGSDRSKVLSPEVSPAPSAPATPTVEPPNQIGNYDIIETLGQGGMGIVYKAHDRRLGRTVAVKVLPSAAWGQAVRLLSDALSGQQQTRFYTEARAVARLQHPNIVQIYDIGEHKGLPYVALEFVGGGSLAQKICKEKLTSRAAAEVVAKLARAVQHAHEQGVLHRDLKPSNVLLTPDGQPKVADFGLAKMQQPPQEDLQTTRTGVILGTPTYMSPEQAAGKVKELGPATDIYGLGTILYELLTGRPPFQSENLMEILSRLMTQPPAPPQTLDAGVPRDLETICLKCLEKDPSRRYKTAADLADDLERWLADKPITAKAARQTWQQRLARHLPFRKQS